NYFSFFQSLAGNQIRIAMNRKFGIQLSRSSFHLTIRNPLYIGQILIPKYMDEDAYFVKGQHDPLISGELFNKVQQILDGNKNIQRPNAKILSDENLPLRGFLLCPHCKRNLSGSA